MVPGFYLFTIYIYMYIFLKNLTLCTSGVDPVILERGGVDHKVGFNGDEEAIKNSLKWRKPDISSFIRKSCLNLKMTIIFVLYGIITIIYYENHCYNYEVE